jgi:hypothetical protein
MKYVDIFHDGGEEQQKISDSTTLSMPVGWVG